MYFCMYMGLPVVSHAAPAFDHGVWVGPSSQTLGLGGSLFLSGYTLPQINMEAHRGPRMEDSSLKRGPRYFHVNLEECRG